MKKARGAPPEHRLIERKEVYRQILDAIADMVLVKGAESRILWANKAFCDYYGMTNEQLRDIIDAPFNEVDYTVQYVKDDHHVYTTGETLNIPEEPVTRHDGVTQIFHTVKSPLQDENGEVRMTVGVSRNITEQKRTKEELARYRQQLEKLVEARTAELADLSDRLQIILASLAEGIVALDANGDVQLMNAAAESLTGWPESEALGRPWPGLVTFEEDSSAAGQDVAGGGDVPTRWFQRFTGTLRDRDGRAHVVSLTGSPLEGKDGTAHGSVLVMRDIGLEREVEERRLRQQKLESVGLLAGGIAHDFNNMLMGLLGSLTIARLKLKAGQDPTAMLEQAEGACLRAQGLTTQLLTFAKGGAPIKKSVRVAPLVREAAELALHGSSVKLVFSCPEDMDAVEADEGQLAQVVTNLVQNAKQARPRDYQVGVLVRSVTLSEGEAPPLTSGRYVVIDVADQGAGIAPENLPKVFDPYFTTRVDGNGLGLASVHSIVQRHGGHTTVTSTEGSGSRFSIYLPSACRADDATTPRSPVKAAVRRRKVLVLDDDRVVREALGTLLQGLGHEVVATGTSAEAFDACDNASLAGAPFELACIDLTMPGDLDGAAVIARLRGQYPALGVVVMSGYSVDPVMAMQQELRLLGALQKPFTLEQLQDVLNRR